jgi:hypothetical protein
MLFEEENSPSTEWESEHLKVHTLQRGKQLAPSVISSESVTGGPSSGFQEEEDEEFNEQNVDVQKSIL